MVLNHKLLRISSRDRDNKDNSSTNDFSITLNNIESIHNLKSVIVKHITFTNAFYNINSKNNTFTYKIAGVPTSVSIAVGNYNSSSLITALDTALAAVGSGTTINTTTAKFTFTTTTNIEYLDISENPMAEILGIERGGGSGGDVASFTPSGVVSLEGLRNLYIRSSNLSFGNLVNSNQNINHDVISIVPITVPFGGIQQYISNHTEIDDIDSLSQSSGKNIQKLNIKLTDYDGDLLDLNGAHITLVLKVYY